MGAGHTLHCVENAAAKSKPPFIRGVNKVREGSIPTCTLKSVVFAMG